MISQWQEMNQQSIQFFSSAKRFPIFSDYLLMRIQIAIVLSSTGKKNNVVLSDFIDKRLTSDEKRYQKLQKLQIFRP